MKRSRYTQGDKRALGTDSRVYYSLGLVITATTGERLESWDRSGRSDSVDSCPAIKLPIYSGILLPRENPDWAITLLNIGRLCLVWLISVLHLMTVLVILLIFPCFSRGSAHSSRLVWIIFYICNDNVTLPPPTPLHRFHSFHWPKPYCRKRAGSSFRCHKEDPHFVR